MKEIVGVEIVMENLESVRINREHIGNFNLTNIRRNIRRVANNSISEYLSADELALQVSSKANVMESYGTTFYEDKKPFDRLREFPDITWIYVKYEDGSEEGIAVPWGGDSDFDNDYQTVEVNEHTGDLYIVISSKETAQNYYSEELDENEAWYWELYED